MTDDSTRTEPLAGGVDLAARERGQIERAALRERFGPIVPAPIAALLEPTTTMRVRLRDVENAAVVARTGLSAGDASLAYVGAARAPATYDAYDDVLTAFAQWCAHAGEALVAPTPLVLVRYISSQAGRRVYGVLRRLLVAVNALHAPLAIDATPATSAWVVRQTLRGIGYEHGRMPMRRARAFVIEYARAAKPWYDQYEQMDPVRATRNFALVALGIATDLRAHSLVALKTDDVTFHPEGVVVTARRTKTRRAHEAPHVVAVHAVPGSPICPVAALERYVRTAALTAGYLFRGVTADGRLKDTMMDTGTVTQIVRQAVRATGLDLDDRQFSSHSLRSGGITSAWERGAEAPAIMAVSDHVSVPQMLHYIRPEDPFKVNHVARLFDAEAG